MKPRAIINGILTLAVLLPALGFSQDTMTRSEIYDNWNELRLTSRTGSARITWLPDGMGYLESEK